MDTLSVLISSHPKLFGGKEPRVASWVPSGWVPLVFKLCDDIETLLQGDCDRFCVEQIKEKFGALRFYWAFVDAGDDWRLVQHPVDAMRFRTEPARSNHPYVRLRNLIDVAEAGSQRVCIRCGAEADPAATRGFYHYCSHLCALAAAGGDYL